MILQNKWIEQLVNSESDARQIRSLRNKRIADNKSGRTLFGNEANPFSFFKDTLQPERLEKLQNAYKKKCPITVRLETPDKTFDVSIRPLKSGILLIADDLSEKIQMEALLSEEQEQIQEAWDNMPTGFYMTDANGQILFANQRLCAWLGKDKESILKHSLSDFIKGKKPPATDMWKGSLTFKGISKNFKTDVIQSATERIGQTFLEGVVLPPAPRKAPNDTLNNPLFFDKAPMGILTVDAVDLTITKTNPLLVRQLGNRTDLIGMPLSNILDNESQEALPLKLSKLLMRAQKFEKCELTFEMPNAESRTFMAYISPIEKRSEDKEIIGYAFYLTNLDERKTLQMQMIHAQKMQAMGQMAGGVAHDFNNLLTAIIGFSDLLLQKHKQGDPSFSDIMQIKNNANRASALVGRLLTFSRKQPLKPKLLDMADEFSDLASLLRRSIGARVELQTDFPPDLGFVKVDPQQLMQVFLNLAVNARDAMPDGGILSITSHVETVKKSKTIGTEVIIPGTYVVIQVSDTGCGISKENLPRIFDPFFSTKEGIAGSGTGLGLSTVYGIITQTDGYIYVTSTVGKGTTFTIYLPRFERKDGPEEKTMRPIIPVALQKANVLLVEDEDAVRAFSARVLRNKGINVVEACDAQEALTHLDAKGETFDLLLTDMMMPGMDGETLCNIAKERYPSLRVILMSGYSEDFARHGKDEDKNFSFLPKPFSLNQLILKVREVLQKKE
ncbi:MAG: response regulator [Alphaproteobacteria bacterium]|nr:response regulator [Alphaproteobacteria bacterium]